MKTAARSPAATYARSNAHGLTLGQQNAVDLLAAGRNDTQTAEALGLNRVTVTRWRLYSPGFRAALADQRAAVWGASADRLRALMPKALETLADALERGDDKITVALAVLKLAGPLPLVPAGPIEADEYVRREVKLERERARNTDESLDAMYDLPPTPEHMKTVRQRLARLAGPAEAEPTFRTSEESR